MSVFAREQAAANQLGGALNIGQYAQNAKRPDTVLESVTSRMATILSRVRSSSSLSERTANAVLGFEGEASGVAAGTASVPTSVCDYLREIEDALGHLERHLGRLT